MPEVTTVTTPQLITQRDEGSTPADSPSVVVQIVTSVVTSTTMVQPTSVALNKGLNNQSSGNNGPDPGQGPKPGLQPPPAEMQWIQSILMNIGLVWMMLTPVVQWVRNWWSRKRQDKLSDEEKLDNALQDSQDGDTQSWESTAASSTTNVSANSSGSELAKNLFTSVVKIMQINWKGPPSC